MTYYGAMTKNMAPVSTSEEQAAIDACEHTRATVEERDGVFSPDGTRLEFVQEFIYCPDCPLGDWFIVDTQKELFDSL